MASLPFLISQSQGREAGASGGLRVGYLLSMGTGAFLSVRLKSSFQSGSACHMVRMPLGGPQELPRPAWLIYKEAHSVRPGQQPLRAQRRRSLLRTLVTERTEAGAQLWGPEQQVERLMGAPWSRKGCRDPMGESALPP